MENIGIYILLYLPVIRFFTSDWNYWKKQKILKLTRAAVYVFGIATIMITISFGALENVANYLFQSNLIFRTLFYLIMVVVAGSVSSKFGNKMKDTNEASQKIVNEFMVQIVYFLILAVPSVLYFIYQSLI